jgi:hypothetical protein
VQQQPIYDVSIPDVHFAWISTLFFPGQRRLDRLLKDDWGLKQIRRIDFGLRNVAGLNENVSTANRNLELLLEEIDKRNKQFFMCFTPVPAEGKNFLTELKKETTYQDMKNENAILLQWFALQIRALSHSDDRHGSSASPSFHIKLVEHLKTDWSRTELMAPHWQPQLRPSRQNVDKNGILHTTASITSASRTEIAMYALEIYYKLSNSTKWRELFLQDDRFVENLARMKSREHHSGLAKYKPAKYAILNILPWKYPHEFHRDPQVYHILEEFRQYQHASSLAIHEKFVLTTPSYQSH